MLKAPFPIDVVYTWAGESSSDNVRSSNNNELKYSLRSVFRYSPWINHIFILVNYPKQIPSWFTSNYSEFVSMVDLRETFPRICDTPNHNSNAIEFTIHRIPKLNEHYIYLNDDFFIGQPLPYTYFFSEEGLPIVSHKVRDSSSLLIDPNHNPFGYPVPDSIAGFYPHVPVPYLKSELVKFEQVYPEYVNWVRATRSRKGDGCDVCIVMRCPCQQMHSTVSTFTYNNEMAIAKELKTKNGTPYGNACSDSYVNSYNLDALEQLLINPTQTFCIQDTESNPDKRKIMYKKVEGFLQKMYPDKAPWEE